MKPRIKSLLASCSRRAKQIKFDDVWRMFWCGRSSNGGALDCGSSGYGFKSHRSPQSIFHCPPGSVIRPIACEAIGQKFESLGEQKHQCLSSSIGRVAVSKTEGWGFDALLGCQKVQYKFTWSCPSGQRVLPAKQLIDSSNLSLHFSFLTLAQLEERRITNPKVDGSNPSGGSSLQRGTSRLHCTSL